MLCIYYQSDRKRICNEVSIHFVSILLLLIFSLGLVMCLLPSNYAGNEEEAVIEAINNSPGNFWISIICPIIYIVLIFIIKSTLKIKMWSDHLVFVLLWLSKIRWYWQVESNKTVKNWLFKCKGHSQTTFTRFVLFLTTYPPPFTFSMV